MFKRSALLPVLVVGCALITLSLAAVTGASLSPASNTFTLRAGDATLGHATEAKTVGVPANPPKADIEIAIDTTGSMQPSIDNAKADANAIVSGVNGLGADTKYAVVQFRDAGDTPEYQVVQDFTSSSTDVSNALNTLTAGGGGDNPEAYNLVFHNSYTPSGLSWRTGTRKFVVVIGDAEPHGAGTAGIPGCVDTSADPHGFNTATELAGMAAAERTLMMIRQVVALKTTTSLACYQGLAAGAFTGGQAIDHGGSLATEITTLISAAFANYNNVHLEVASASPAPANASWIAFTPASVGPVPAPSTQNFSLTVTVPTGTPAGTYLFDIVALADGTDIGHQALTIVVPAKQLTLTPTTATNPIGTSHTVTAHAFDVLGPYVGDTVVFSVSGGPAAVPTSGSKTTTAAGTATFTFTNTPSAPGTNTIMATDGPLSATATKEWLNAPPSCTGVKLSQTELWPPNHKLVTVTASGATDGDIGDTVTIAVTAISQDEPVNGAADGNTAPDAVLTSPASASGKVRAERAGTGDGRVYKLTVVATDKFGATCTTTRTVSVPHDQSGPAAVDSSPPSYNSLLP